MHHYHFLMVYIESTLTIFAMHHSSLTYIFPSLCSKREVVSRCYFLGDGLHPPIQSPPDPAGVVLGCRDDGISSVRERTGEDLALVA